MVVLSHLNIEPHIMSTVVDTKSFLEEAFAGCFDSLCNILFGRVVPSAQDVRDLFHTDVYAFASEGIREQALGYYAEVRTFESEEFKLFMEEAYDGPTDETLLGLPQDIKADFYNEFELHLKVKTLGRLISEFDFNPLYFTGYQEGLAVLYVQSPSLLCNKILDFLEVLFEQNGHTFDSFSLLPFEEQKTFYGTFLKERVIQEEQALDSVWPKPVVPAAT